ncbi:MAG: NADH-quinone oxidoreductase subunit NuoE [Deltaproteobacteria bacterium]|nr:NADH-quinone oxidoreductase subunit NuoE [Deltaproteobacteria bacterium]
MNAKERLDKVFAKHHRSRDALIPLLQDIQEIYGFLPPEPMAAAARFCRIDPVEVYGVATFYAQFKFSQLGKNTVMVCQGTACHVMGGARILEEVMNQLGVEPGQTSKDGMFTLERVACIGACALAPAMVVNKDTHGRMKAEKVTEILNAYRNH